MILAGLPLILALASPARSVEAPVSKPRSEIRALASFSGPAGWLEEEDEVLGDPLVRFSSGPYTVRVSLFGGKKSRHETPAAFLSDFEALGEGDKPPGKLGLARVGAKKYPAYRRRYEVSGRDPHAGGPPGIPETIQDDFVIVPAGERFFVLTLKTRLSPAYEPDKSGELAWKRLLETFKLKKPKR